MYIKNTFFFLNFFTFLSIFPMEVQEQREEVLTLLDLLIEHSRIERDREVKKRREIKTKYENKKPAQVKSFWLESRTVLDHIRLNHKWGTLYLQIAPSKGTKTGFVISLFPPYFGCKTWRVDKNENHEKFIQHFSELFSSKKIHQHMSISVSSKYLDPNPDNVGLYTAWLDITPWQDFFFELMPWHYQNPNYYAFSIATIASLVVWYCTKEYYKK